METSANLLVNNRPNVELLPRILAVMDVGRMPTVVYTNPSLQNSYWEGFTEGNKVINLFIWYFRGLLIHAAVNYSGSWHDSRVAASSGFYRPLLESKTPGYAILADSAFPRVGGFIQGKIVRARKAIEIRPSSNFPRSSWLVAVGKLLERAMPSESQSAEWGVRSIKEPFRRFSTKLPGNSDTRFKIIALCAHL